MRKASILIAACMMLAVALNVWAYQRTHPEIMQTVLQTRNAVTANIEAGDAAATAESAMQLQGLFQELIPIYERMNLAPAITIANKAIAITGETAKAAKANNMEAAAAAHGNIGKACGGCHDQFREKAEDGSFRIKTGG
jgi:hypothetical protein